MCVCVCNGNMPAVTRRWVSFELHNVEVRGAVPPIAGDRGGHGLVVPIKRCSHVTVCQEDVSESKCIYNKSALFVTHHSKKCCIGSL